MKGTHHNQDFVYLAILPLLAAAVFFIFYVGGWLPQVPVPRFAVPWASSLDGIRQAASQNEASAIAVAVAILAGIMGFTWLVYLVLDLKKGMQTFVRWILHRPPALVSGVLKPEDQTWNSSTGRDDETAKTYRAKTGHDIR
jgi:hypothetical protein